MSELMVVDKLQILVFRSNIDNNKKVKLAKRELLGRRDIYNVSIDLEDWEKVLRVRIAAKIN